MNAFLPRSKSSSLGIIVSDDRISPEIELSERSSLFKFDSSRSSSGGMETVMLIKDKFRFSKLVRLVMCVGKNPISIPERSRLCNLVIDDKTSHVIGNERPERSLPERSNDFKFVK